MTLETTSDQAKGMPPDAPKIRAGSGSNKVRLLTLSDLDRRGHAYRRATALIAALEADAGGADRLSASERVLVQRAGVLAALAEDLETRWLGGKSIDAALLCTLGNALRRQLEAVGLRRAPRDVTPDGDDERFLDMLAPDVEGVSP
jgi:hypothetical protein